MWLQQGHSGKEAGCGDGTSSEQQQLRRRGGRGGCSHPTGGVVAPTPMCQATQVMFQRE